MEKESRYPERDTQAYALLELAAVCGEFPACLLSRLPGSDSYKEKVVASLKKAGLLRTYYRDKLRGYRLGKRAKNFLLSDRPERFSFYLDGKTDTNSLKSEAPRRLRLHRIAESYVLMQNAGAEIFRDKKPRLFAPEGSSVSCLETPAFYSSREIKEMGAETVKIRGSRMTGVLLAPSDIFIVYNGGTHMTKWDYRAEQRAQVLLKIVVCHQRLPAQYAGTEISGLLFGNGLEPFYQILSGGDGASRCFFLLDGDYGHFYYLTNDRPGEVLLRLLGSPGKLAELSRMLMQDLSGSDPDLPVEHDAVDEEGDPVLFGYFLDLPRLNRFFTALRLQGRRGTVVCFDFQKEVLCRIGGERVSYSVISFEKFERRFFL